MARILGAILAGGASRRFGADKATATWRTLALIDHAIAALGPQAAVLAVIGRDHPGLERIDDRPPDAGPIGGLAAAIHRAAGQGLAGVLIVPVDVHPLPPDLWARLGGDGAAVFADQHLVGWWPASLAPAIDAYVGCGGRAMRGWIDACGARRVADPQGLVNVNRPSDLARLPR